MRAKEHAVLDRAIEEGVAYGWRRAHKHTDNPTKDEILAHIEQAVMFEICEWFEFRNEYENSNDS